VKVRRSVLKDQATVSTYAGEGAYGPIVADPRTVWCNVDETRRLVRDANGDEAVSEATLHLHPQTRTVPAEDTVQVTLDPLAVFTPESPVTIRGRDSRVLAAKPHTIRGKVVMVEVTCA
jgi:hypothetical protein